MVYFGWLEAHEDDAERAVRAGLAVVDAIALLNTRFNPEQNVKLSVRAGIDTGSVVVVPAAIRRESSARPPT